MTDYAYGTPKDPNEGFKTILYEKMRKGVRITVNQPERLNAISWEMADEITAALKRAEADQEIRAVVIVGAGRAFSSGYDMTRSQAPTVWPYGLPEGENVAHFLDEWRRQDLWEDDCLLQIWELTKPVIAAVHGWCMGAASFYALACHMTLAADDAVFGQPEVRMGADTTFFWTLNAGYKHALRYGLTGDHIDANEALRIGIVNNVFPRERLQEEAFNIVERIALVSPETVKINLQVATMGLEMMGLRNAIRMNTELKAMVHSSKREEFQRPLDEASARGGLRAFLETRDGPFQPEPFGPRSRPRPAN